MHRNLYRGLAVAAVSSMAITLAPSAHADSIETQVGTGHVVLFSQFNTAKVATIKADGTDSTIHLEAGAGSDISSVTFQYSINGGAFTNIATASRNDDGTFTHEWAPEGAVLGANNVTVRATATVGGNAVNSDATALSVQPAGGAAASVNLADGSALGVFQQPYGAGHDAQLVTLSGTTSATNGTVHLTRRDGSGAAAGAATDATVNTATGASTGTFRDTLDISGYHYDASPTNPSNQVVFGAENGSDDTEAYSLYVQKITTVTATATDTTVSGSGTAPVTVKVLDQNGKPIAGARVATGTTTQGYTNIDGELVVQQPAGTATYYADATNAAGYSANDGDQQSDPITVTSYNPVATKLAGKSADGAAYDEDEFSSGDLTIEVQDQNGKPVAPAAGQQVNYYWTTTPFGGGTVVREPAGTATSTAVATATPGVYTVAKPATAGTSVLHAELSNSSGGTGGIGAAEVLTVKHGQAALTFDDASPQQVPSGTTATVTGSLKLPDGTALANRNIDLTYTRGAAGTGSETPTPKDATPDSGLVQGNGSLGLSLTVKTGADGTFTASVKDPAETPNQPIETGGELSAETGNTPQIGDADASAGPQGIDFVTSVDAGTVTVADPTNLLGSATPGRPVKSSVTVKSADGTTLANQTVTLTTDHGYFTTDAANAGALEPASTATNGADAGAYKNLGKSIEVKTNSSGVATFTLAIDRDSDFDDDGAVTSTVTAKAGGATGTNKVQWSSEDPYNGGDVTLEVSPQSVQAIKSLPKAPTSSYVYYEVKVTDQFGNPVAGETVDIADDTNKADISESTVTSNLTEEGDFYASADEAVDQTITATWDADTHTFHVTGTAPAQTVTVDPGSETLTDSDTINWYEADLATADYTLEHTPSGTVPVGGTVRETYTVVDNNGEPVPNVYVQFFRTGAGAENNGQPAFEGFTNDNGKISFVFQGTKAGTATIVAIAREGSSTGPVIDESQKTDTIKFGTEKATIKAKIRGRNVGKKGNDRVYVTAPASAHGAKVELYKIVKGKAVRVRGGHLNANGGKVFTVKDAKPKSRTKYAVVVYATARTKQAISNTINMK